MKKISNKLIPCILIICLSIVLLTGCDFISEIIDKITPKELTINIDSKIYTTNAFVGEEVKFELEEIPTKAGYYLAGYYDSEVGGTEYLDCDGKSNGVWEEENPTTLYARWESVDNYCIINLAWKSFSYFGKQFINAAINPKLDSMNVVSALVGNWDGKIKAEFSFKMACPAYCGVGDDPDKDTSRGFYFQDSDGSDAEAYVKKGINVHGLDYNEFSFDIECDAHTFGQAEDYADDIYYVMNIKFIGSPYYPTYVKDAKLKVYLLSENG